MRRVQGGDRRGEIVGLALVTTLNNDIYFSVQALWMLQRQGASSVDTIGCVEGQKGHRSRASSLVGCFNWESKTCLLM